MFFQGVGEYSKGVSMHRMFICVLFQGGLIKHGISLSSQLRRLARHSGRLFNCKGEGGGHAVAGHHKVVGLT